MPQAWRVEAAHAVKGIAEGEADGDHLAAVFDQGEEFGEEGLADRGGEDVDAHAEDGEQEDAEDQDLRVLAVLAVQRAG